VRVAPGVDRPAAEQDLLDRDAALPEIEAEVRDGQLREMRGVRGLSDPPHTEIRDAELPQLRCQSRAAARLRREVVVAVETEDARREVDARELADVAALERNAEVRELEAALRRERRQREAAAPVERGAAARLRVQVVGVVRAAGRAEVAHLDAE